MRRNLVRVVAVALVALVAWVVLGEHQPPPPAAGDRPRAGLVDDGPLSEHDAQEAWAPIYVHNGGLVTVYREIFEDADCAHVQGRFDSGMMDVKTRQRGSGMQLMGWGYATAASWRGDMLGCPNFKGMNNGELYP